jgi:hypothetical protein
LSGEGRKPPFDAGSGRMRVAGKPRATPPTSLRAGSRWTRRNIRLGGCGRTSGSTKGRRRSRWRAFCGARAISRNGPAGRCPPRPHGRRRPRLSRPAVPGTLPRRGNRRPGKRQHGRAGAVRGEPYPEAHGSLHVADGSRHVADGSLRVADGSSSFCAVYATGYATSYGASGAGGVAPDSVSHAMRMAIQPDMADKEGEGIQ